MSGCPTIEKHVGLLKWLDVVGSMRAFMALLFGPR